MADAGRAEPAASPVPLRSIWGFMPAATLVFTDVLAQLAAAFLLQGHTAFLGGSEVQKARIPLFALSSVL